MKKKVQLFCCSSLISVIVASALISRKFFNCTNVLVLIRNNRIDKKKEIIEDCIIQGAPWDFFYTLNTKSSFIESSKLLWPLNYLPFESIFVLKNKKIIVNEFKEILNNHLHIDQYFFGDNVFLLKYFYNNKMNEISFIEHGASSYRWTTRSNNSKLKKIIKKLFLIFTGGSDSFSVKQIYLSGNKKNITKNQSKEEIAGFKRTYININQSIIKTYLNFINHYQVREREAFKELILIKNLCKQKKHVYIYMPTSIVADGDYLIYLKKQLEVIDTTNCLFLIKPHSNDRSRNYEKYFSDLALQTFIFKNEINFDIPVEFLLLFFEEITLFGSYSTSHLYAKWWFNKNTIFAEVKDSEINHILVKEYEGTLEDFH